MKISQSEYLTFVDDYKSGIGDTRYQRFGQAFLNKFFPTGNDAEIFYCVDDNISYRLIAEKYVDWDTTEGAI